jgi:5'-nucleotidase
MMRPSLRVVLPLVLLTLARGASGQPAGPAVTPGGFVILLGNDDGFDAPGLRALVKALAGFAELYVSAPAQNQSGKGHSITITETIVVRQRQVDGVTLAFAVEATPATAMRVGLEKYIPKKPTLVISGINRGENLGTSVYLSGTLGAAREAAFSGIPAIAVSLEGNKEEDYAATATFVRGLVEQLRAKNLITPGFFLNVNVPEGTPKGVMVTRLSTKASQQLYDCTPPARDRAACFSGYEQVRVDDAGTDVAEFFRGYITLTPMTLDVTDYKAMDVLRPLERKAAVAAAAR